MCGIKIADEEILSPFADDTTFFKDGSKESFYTRVSILQHFK